MGGLGSGNHGGRPVAEHGLKVDLAWMLRTGRAQSGCLMTGSLWWSRGGDHAGSIGYEADLRDPDNAWLLLKYKRGDEQESVRQQVRLTYTRPNFGGRRWWMICPYRHIRIGKLYLPNGGDRFASRKAWRLAHASQRSARRDRPFDRLQRLQRKLGMNGTYEDWPRRPKGMWHRTYQRHLDRYEQLQDECDYEMALVIGRFMGR